MKFTVTTTTTTQTIEADQETWYEKLVRFLKDTNQTEAKINDYDNKNISG